MMRKGAGMSEYRKYVKKTHFGFLLLLTLSSISFFKPIIFENTSYEVYLYTACLIICFPAALLGFKKKSALFALPLKILLTAIIIGIFTAYIYWHQDFISSLSASVTEVMGYIVFFYLVKKKITSKTIERVILIVGLLFASIFIISFFIYPKKIVEFYDLGADRGFQRIFVTGDGFLFMLFFLSINKYVSYKKKFWLTISLVTYGCIILTLTRVYIFGATLLSVIYFFYSTRVYTKIIIGLVIIAMFFYVPDLKFVKSLQSQTNEQTSDFQNYIRYQAADYFTSSSFQPSIVTFILGNGFAYGEKTGYGNEINRLRSEGFYIEDLGLLGLYIHLGIIAILAYVMIFYKGLRTKLDGKFVYLKLFVTFMMFLSFTTSVTFNTSFILPIVFTLYLYDQAKLNAEHMPESSSNVYKLPYYYH